jgi:hypothetical protein
VIMVLRRLRMTAVEIAEIVAMPLSTVSAVLTRTGLGKLSRLEPPEPPNRYQRRHPGELIHVDVKKLGRIKGGAGKRITGECVPPQLRAGHRRRRQAAADSRLGIRPRLRR